MTESAVRITGRRQRLALQRSNAEHRKTAVGPSAGASWCPPRTLLTFCPTVRIPLGSMPFCPSTSLGRLQQLKAPCPSLELESISVCTPCPQVNRDTPREDAVWILRNVNKVLVNNVTERGRTQGWLSSSGHVWVSPAKPHWGHVH